MADRRRWSALARGALLCTTLCSLARADLVVVQGADTGTNTARQLAQQLAPGVTVVSASLRGTNGAVGSFSGGSSVGLELDQGILLSSGRVLDALGPNDEPDTSTDCADDLGDAQLAQILGSDTTDAAALTLLFNCPPGSRSVSVDYVFASDAYDGLTDPGDIDEYDGAAIIVDGVNAATLPGPVPLSAPSLPSRALFHDNNTCHEDESLACPFNLEADGFSGKLTARASLRTSGTHTAKIVIADDFLPDIDSWIFLRGFSCNADVFARAVPASSGPGTLGLGAALLAVASLALSRARRPRMK
jgi:hypothetical protein